MATICPTILADNPHTFREQIERVAPFAERVQIDLPDGLCAGTQSLKIDQVWWPYSVLADLHLMYERPDLYIDKIIKLNPSMVIIHAEAEGNFSVISKAVKKSGIKIGVALLSDTSPDILLSSL